MFINGWTNVLENCHSSHFERVKWNDFGINNDGIDQKFICISVIKIFI